MKNILSLMLLTTLLSGCSKGESQPQGVSPPPGGPVAPGGKAEAKPKVSRGGGIFGVRDETEYRLILRNIGVACKVEDTSRLPNTLEELKAIVKDTPKALKPLESGEFVLAPNARVAGDSLFLYERDADSRGNRLVLMGDGTVHKKSAEEFAALAK